MPTAKELLDDLLKDMANPVVDLTQHVTGIIYGESGGGKTILALELAQRIRKMYGGKILFVDAVNAWRSVKNHPSLQEGLVRVPYKGKEQLDTIASALEYRPEGFEDITVVILDEMSSMTDKDGDVVLKARSAADSNKDPDVLTQPDMGATTERMRRTVGNLLKQTNVSIIFVSHQRDDEDKNVGYKKIRPRFMPKFSGTIREALDFVVYMAAEPRGSGESTTYSRTIQAHPTRTVVAKTRVGGLRVINSPEVFIDAVEKWLREDRPQEDQSSIQILDDTIPNVSEDYTSNIIDE